MSLVFALALAHANSVDLDGGRWRALQAPDEPRIEVPAPTALSRDVRIDPRADEVRFEATWTLRAVEPRWFEARIAGRGVQIARATYRGKELAITEAEDGVRIAVKLEGDGVLSVSGVKEGVATREAVELDLLPAAVGRVRVQTAAKPVITAQGAVIALGDGIWTGAPKLAVRLVDRAPPAPRPDLAMATAALGLTIGEGSYDARGRVRWEVRHGELSTVVLDVRGAGSDLDVTGPALSSWSRSGDRVTAILREPEDRLVELELSWSGPVPSGDEASLPLPGIRPQGAFKTESSVQLARDGEIELVPRLQSWTAVSFADLPEWGRGLVAGTPTATFTAGGTPEGTVGLFRFTPVSGPPTFVDVATITAAATEHGNVLMRAHYAVRNDRSAHLRVTPPEGAVVVGARVAGDTARVAMDGRTWLIPLGKSVETVEGLLAFPVEVVLLLPGSAWDKREERGLPIPSVDAPVAVTRATLYLPPGYESKLEDGDGDVVADFTEGEGIAYGQGSGSSAQAEALMQEAVQAWMANDFENAEAVLRELEDVGGFDANAQRLQSNLDVISGKASGQYDVAMERRVKEQAKARSLQDQQEQEEVLKEAEQSYLSGDYAKAEKAYEKALDLGEKLDKLEQDESVEQEVRNVALESRLERTKEEAKKKEKEQVAFKAAAEADARRRAEEESRRKSEAEWAQEGARNRAEAEAESFAAVEAASQRVTVSKDQIVILDGATVDAPVRDPEPIEEMPATTEVLTEEFLARVPVGRTYQSAIGVAPGVTDKKGKLGKGGNKNISGGASSENTYVFDDLDITGELVLPEDDALYGVEADNIAGVEGAQLGGVVGGVAGGVVGGEISGVHGASLGGAVADDDREFIEIDLADEEEGLDYDEPVQTVTASADVQILKRSKPQLIPKIPKVQIGGRKDADAPPPPPAENKPEPEKPAVTAVQLTAVIPTQGQAVRYEHLLLESNAAYVLPIDARFRRRDR